MVLLTLVNTKYKCACGRAFSYRIDWQTPGFSLSSAACCYSRARNRGTNQSSVFVGVFDMDDIADIPWRAEIPCLLAC